MNISKRTIAYLLLFITAAIWGFAGPVIKYTLAYFPPSVFLTYRFAVSALIAMIFFMAFPPHISVKPRQYPQILLYGFLTSTAALGLLFIGFDKTTALTGSIISALSPLMITAAGALVLHERVTKQEKLGSMFALVGTLLMIAEPLLSGISRGIPMSFEGNMYHLAALAITIATAILAKVVLRHFPDPLALTNISFIVGFVTMIPIMLANHSTSEVLFQLSTAPLSGHLGVLYMALLSGTLAYTLWHIGEQSIEIGETSLFSYLMPMFAAPLSFFWLHEPITPVFVASTLVIACGVAIAEYRKSGRPLQPARRRKG